MEECSLDFIYFFLLGTARTFWFSGGGGAVFSIDRTRSS